MLIVKNDTGRVIKIEQQENDVKKHDYVLYKSCYSLRSPFSQSHNSRKAMLPMRT
jgi:hypothetical protein